MLVAFGTSPYYPNYQHCSFQLAETIIDRCIDVRRLGAAELDISYVACGRTGGFFELVLQPWDYAAGSIILTEAGGKIITADGRPLPFGEKCGVIDASDTVFDELTENILPVTTV